MERRQGPVEDLVNTGTNAFCSDVFWKDRRVFLTGSTGFKGSWLALWLSSMGARVAGYALPPEQPEDLFTVAGIDAICSTTLADIRDEKRLARALADFAPQTIFHLAAQPLVRRSYVDPLETWSTNVIGTCNLLEAARHVKGLESVVVVATDKCYRNYEWDRGYREVDELGGDDPYSASKAATEIAVASFRKSFYAAGGIGLASARAGNVVGGGDWAKDRLVPDIVRAWRKDEEIVLRYPHATRPWQHVLDCLHGYIRLAERLHADRSAYSRAFNFGPSPQGEASVLDVIELMSASLPVKKLIAAGVQPHEASRLVLDSTLAAERLGWQVELDLAQTMRWTADWYARFVGGEPARDITLAQLQAYRQLLSQKPGLSAKGSS